MRHIRIIAGVLICILLLWFLFRGTDWMELRAALANVDMAWLTLSVVLAFASLFARVQRWSYVVRATHPAKFSNIFSATQIGMLVNSIVPARLGDLVRAYVLARLERIPLAQSLTLVALDRINDILALVVVLLIALLSFPSDRDIEFAAGAFGNAEPFTVSSGMIEPATTTLAVGLVGLILVLGVLYAANEHIVRWVRQFFAPRFPHLADWTLKIFMSFIDGMHIFRSGLQAIKSIVYSLLTWGLVALSLGTLLIAFGLETPWFGPFLILAILGVFTIVTVTPGLIGQYHVAVVASLLMITPDINLNEAKAYAIVAHLVALVPPIVLGVYCMVRENFQFQKLFSREMRSQG